MKRIQHIWGIWALALTCCGLQAQPLKVGDPAPPFAPGSWIQGTPVSFDSNHIYIIEFWATWCPPCRTSIPHLNDLYQKFKDRGLVVIGQNCQERDEASVPPFVRRMGEQMTYPVALDDKRDGQAGRMAHEWLQAAGRKSLPTAFIVTRSGKITWIGHPMQLTEQMTERVLRRN